MPSELRARTERPAIVPFPPLHPVDPLGIRLPPGSSPRPDELTESEPEPSEEATVPAPTPATPPTYTDTIQSWRDELARLNAIANDPLTRGTAAGTAARIKMGALRGAAYGSTRGAIAGGAAAGLYHERTGIMAAAGAGRAAYQLYGVASAPEPPRFVNGLTQIGEGVVDWRPSQIIRGTANIAGGLITTAATTYAYNNPEVVSDVVTSVANATWNAIPSPDYGTLSTDMAQGTAAGAVVGGIGGGIVGALNGLYDSIPTVIPPLPAPAPVVPVIAPAPAPARAQPGLALPAPPQLLAILPPPGPPQLLAILPPPGGGPARGGGRGGGGGQSRQLLRGQAENSTAFEATRTPEPFTFNSKMPVPMSDRAAVATRWNALIATNPTLTLPTHLPPYEGSSEYPIASTWGRIGRGNAAGRQRVRDRYFNEGRDPLIRMWANARAIRYRIADWVPL